MTAAICATCGVQQADLPESPAVCPICADERQYLPPGGQRWTTLAELRAAGHRSEVRELEPGLLGVGATPKFGIGQRALLVAAEDGGVLWDPPGFLDDAAVDAVRAAGGVAAISASHPHFYGVAVEWAHAFPGARVLLPEDDRRWIQRPDPAVELWSGQRPVAPGVTLLQCGGHFAGSAVLHWADGADGRGALLVGDTVTVVADRRWLTFMRSYPNQIPLPERAIRHIVEVLEPWRYDRIYGGWWDDVVEAGGAAAVRRSAERYLRWISPAAPLD